MVNMRVFSYFESMALYNSHCDDILAEFKIMLTYNAV